MSLLDSLGFGPKARAYVVIKCMIYEGGYNIFMQNLLRASGVRGWMRPVDRPMGSYIEVEIEGSKLKLDKIIEQLRVGPPMAKIYGLEVEWRPFRNNLQPFRLKL